MHTAAIDTSACIVTETILCYYFLLGYYSDCKDAFEQGQKCSGVYKIRPENIRSSFAAFAVPPFDVYCDMENDGGGWTIFQRRINGIQNFYLNWIDYVRGFGDVRGEFWLGLHKIHRLTASSTNLRVDLADFAESVRYAKYSAFHVGDSDSKFTLTVSGYSGTAGDALAHNNNRQFSTKDQDNDSSGGHCAQRDLGGWWYGTCTYANLNGHYYMGPNSPSEKGVIWHHWRGHYYSLKVTEMKVRHV